MTELIPLTPQNLYEALQQMDPSERLAFATAVRDLAQADIDKVVGDGRMFYYTKTPDYLFQQAVFEGFAKLASSHEHISRLQKD